jgi:hypothetical protein
MNGNSINMKLNPQAEYLKNNPKAPISNWIIEEYSKLEQKLIDLQNTHSTLLVALEYNRQERDSLKNLLTSGETPDLNTISKERDEADRRAGAAERDLEKEREDSQRRASWLWQAKQEWGVNDNVSFDVIWEECLRLKANSQSKNLLTSQEK